MLELQCDTPWRIVALAAEPAALVGVDATLLSGQMGVVVYAWESCQQFHDNFTPSEWRTVRKCW